MFIWRGAGILVPVIAFACSLIGELLTRNLGGNEYWDTHSYPLSMALLVAGGLIWATDSYLFRHPGRILRDEQTGERVLLAPKHDFFFMRMRWWTLVCIGFAIAILLAPK
jgi:hypothetical protein